MFTWLVLLSTAFATASAVPDKSICYYASWAGYRPGNGRFTIDDIEPNLCTHLIYSFVGLNDNGTIRILDSWHDIVLGGFAKFNRLKIKNRNLKTLVAIGGVNAGSETFSKVAGDSNLRAKFVNEAVKFLQKYGFNGFDLNWMYPARRGGSPADKSNFSKLLAELRAAFNPHHFLLTAAVSAPGYLIDTSYDVPQLSIHLDFINVMTYNLHTSHDGKTGQNAPLYASIVDETPFEKERNVDACIRNWIKKGAHPNKLVLGIATFGQTFTLANANNHKLGAPTKGAGIPGPYTRQTGILGYNEICEIVKRDKCIIVWDDQQKVPYAYNGYKWTSYDNPRSVEIKINYAKTMNLGGVMVWSIDTDDFKGMCGPAYPILNRIKLNLGVGILLRSGFPVDEEFKCIEEGYFRHPTDCSKFYHCEFNGEIFDISRLECPDKFHFDKEGYACRDPSVFPCEI